MLFSILFIHLSGGQIETHFQRDGSSVSEYAAPFNPIQAAIYASAEGNDFGPENLFGKAPNTLGYWGTRPRKICTSREPPWSRPTTMVAVSPSISSASSPNVGGMR